MGGIVGGLLLVFVVAGCKTVPEKQDLCVDPTVQSYKDIPGVTQEEIVAIEALKVGRTKFSYGAMVGTETFPLPDGSHGGFTMEFCARLSQLFGIPFVPEIFGWNDLIDHIEARSVDFTGELTPTEKRQQEKGYLMTIPIAERLLRIFTHVDSDKIQVEADTEGRTIAFLENTTTAGDIRKIYRVSFKSVEVADYPTAARQIQSGEIDAFIDEAVADPAFDEFDFINSQIFFPMVHSPISMTTANPELAPIISVVNKYIGCSSHTGNDIYDLYNAGDFAYARHKLDKLLTDAEKAYINDLRQRNEPVRVAFEQDNYPTNFYNEKEGEYQGIAADVLSEISKLLDIEFKIVGTNNLIWAEIYEKVKTGEIPMAAQLLRSKPRKEFFIWTTAPYAKSYYAIVSKADFPNKSSYQIIRYSVGVMKQSGHADTYRSLFPNNNNLIEYDTFDDCLNALERGEVELWMASEHEFITQTHYREKTGLKINLRLTESMDSYFGFNKNEKLLCSIISKAQQFVQTDTIDAHWTTRTYDYTKKIAEQRVFFMEIFSGVVLLLLAVCVFLLVRTMRLERKLKDIAHKDMLTDIMNRRFFMELAAIQMERVCRTDSQCFIVIYDLDHFKMINDKFGHLAGDKVLKETVQRVKAAIRPYDLFGRYGGEEFILLMTDISHADAINAVERLRQVICRSPVKFENIPIPVTASFGLAAIHPAGGMNTATKHADAALYQAKEGGRNRVVFYQGK